MNFFKRLELEWKILILAAALFIAFAWPVQRIAVSRLEATLEQSVDPGLDSLLRDNLTRDGDNDAALASIERSRQWKALIPTIVREQRQSVFGFSAVLFLLLIALALWTLKSLTRPLKNLAAAVERIGRGERADVSVQSGGALGTVEQAVVRLQDELGVLREQARVQGMEKAWQDIARVMAHEIKNPLTPMRLSLDRMEEKLSRGEALDAESMKTLVGRVNAQIDVLERLVNQFRSFSREPEASIRTVGIRDEISKVAGDLSSRLATSIEGRADVQADPYLLSQVLLNVWKNALEAGATRVDVRVAEAQDVVEVRACDNGKGIDKKELERVWLPYVSLKKGGTGLGLPVIRRLIETMGGKVRLEGGDGLCVVMTFKAAKQGEANHE